MIISSQHRQRNCINFRRIQKLTTLIQLFGLFWKSVNWTGFCDIACPECGSSLSVSLGTHLGFVREKTLKCSDCDYKQQQFTSPWLGKAERQNDGFEVNSRGILFTHEIALGYASLNKLCAVYHCMVCPICVKKIVQKKDKAVCNTTDAAAVATTETF